MSKSKKVELPIVRLFRMVYAVLNALMAFVGVIFVTLLITVALTSVMLILLLIHGIAALL